VAEMYILYVVTLTHCLR